MPSSHDWVETGHAVDADSRPSYSVVMDTGGWTGRWARGVLFTFLLFTPLVFTGHTLEAFETPKIALVQLAAIALAALATIAIIERTADPPLRLRDPLLIGIGLFVLSAVISTCLSVSPHVSFFGSIESAAGLTTVLAYAIIVAATLLFVTTPAQVRWLLFAPVIAATVATAYALVQAFGADPYPWKASSTIGTFVRPFATLGHANSLAGYLVTVLPITVWFAVSQRGLRRWAAGLGALLMTAAIGLTLTRSAWLALGTLIVLGVVCMVRNRRSVSAQAIELPRDDAKRRVGYFRYGTMIAAVGILMPIAGWIAAGPVVRQSVAERLSHFFESGGRLSLWRAGLAMAAAHPLTGVGLDCYAISFGRVRPIEYWQSEWNTTPTRAHNDVIQILATQGAFGLLALAVFVSGIVIAARRGWTERDNRGMVLALAACLLALVVHDMFSFTVAATGSLAAALVGCLAALSRSAPIVKTPADPHVRLRAATAAVAIAVAWIGVVEPLAADITCRKAECRSLSDPMAALNDLEAAVAQAPQQDLLWFKLSQGARAAARVTEDPAIRRQLDERAKAAQETAIHLVPEHPSHRAHYARLMSELAREGLVSSSEAIKAFDKALARDPHNPGLLADAGHAAWAFGQPQLARRYLACGMELDPNQANLRALSGLVAMAEGHFEEAEEHFSAAASRNWHGNEEGQLQAMTVWAACLVKLNHPDHAELVARNVLNHCPDWPAPRYTLGYALAMMGRRAEAAEAYRFILARWPNHPLATEARRELNKVE